MLTRAIRILGILSLACGVMLGGFLLYQYQWSNNTSTQIQEIKRDETLFKWSTNTTAPFHQMEPAPFEKGETIALMYIPRMRDEAWGVPVIEGTEDEHLSAGIGHYPLTAKPGEVGNFVTFGHRTTHGQPYSRIELLEAGDKVYVQTEHKWFVYELKVDTIVEPTDTWVMRSRALEHARISGITSKHLITLITCTPRHSTKQRWVWWGTLTEVRDREDSPL